MTVLNNSELLLGKNTPNPRKRLVLASIANAENELRNQRHDLICVNWVLHHLIGDTPSETDALVDEALSTSRNLYLLSDNGRISVFEHMYDGILVDDLPGQLIYRITKSRILAEPARRMGANTAGVGVRFRSKRAWKNTFDRLGLTVLRYCAIALLRYCAIAISRCGPARNEVILASMLAHDQFKGWPLLVNA